MKNNILVLIIFSLVLVLPFVSYTQQTVIDSTSVLIIYDDIYGSIATRDSTFIKDSIYERKLIEHISDSIIVKMRIKDKNYHYKWGDIDKEEYYVDYTMNGAIISKHDIKKRLSIFKSSASELRKSKNRVVAAPIVFTTATLGFLFFFGWYIEAGNDAVNNNNPNPSLQSEQQFKRVMASLGCLAIGIPVGISIASSSHDHYKKAIRLYNEEIIKRKK